MQYAIYHKSKKAWFTGFGSDGAPIWADRGSARGFESKLLANAQASLFACSDSGVQKTVKALR